MTLRSGKEIDKIIAPKGVNQGENESRGLGHKIESKTSESKKDKGKEKEHVSLEDLKYALFPHRLTKASKTNLNAEMYDVFKQVRINITFLCQVLERLV